MCAGQAYVTGIAGAALHKVLGLGLSLNCSDGSQVPLAAGTLSGGAAFSLQSSSGFVGFTARSGALMEQLGVITAAGEVKVYGGSGGDPSGEARCPEGTLVAGVFGEAQSTAMLSLDVYCRVA